MKDLHHFKLLLHYRENSGDIITAECRMYQTDKACELLHKSPLPFTIYIPNYA